MAVSLPLHQQRGAIANATIPVIDLGPYYAGETGALAAAAADLRDALEGIGFFILVNHRVPQDLIDRTFAEARRFHAQPLDVKMALRLNEHNNGYVNYCRLKATACRSGGSPCHVPSVLRPD